MMVLKNKLTKKSWVAKAWIKYAKGCCGEARLTFGALQTRTLGPHFKRFQLL